jgi:hypothetical protein
LAQQLHGPVIEYTVQSGVIFSALESPDGQLAVTLFEQQVVEAKSPEETIMASLQEILRVRTCAEINFVICEGEPSATLLLFMARDQRLRRRGSFNEVGVQQASLLMSLTPRQLTSLLAEITPASRVAAPRATPPAVEVVDQSLVWHSRQEDGFLSQWLWGHFRAWIAENEPEKLAAIDDHLTSDGKVISKPVWKSVGQVVDDVLPTLPLQFFDAKEG